MSGRLVGKTAVITGACGGIGRVACRSFCTEGASVLGVDLDQGAGERLADELRADGLEFEFRCCDISSSSDVAVLAKHAKAKFGGLDILYNNAGVILAKPLLAVTDEEWDRVQGVNLRGVFLTMRELVPLMEGRQASIVNTSSGLGLVGAEYMSAYCAAKGGVIMLTKAAALELGPGIRVNAICPGVIDTPMPREIAAGLPDDVGAALLHGFAESHVAKRLGTPAEVVSVALFLAGDEAGFVTGAAIPVDSGITAR